MKRESSNEILKNVFAEAFEYYSLRIASNYLNEPAHFGAQEKNVYNNETA
jgi:hypothetical protein